MEVRLLTGALYRCFHQFLQTEQSVIVPPDPYNSLMFSPDKNSAWRGGSEAGYMVSYDLFTA